MRQAQYQPRLLGRGRHKKYRLATTSEKSHHKGNKAVCSDQDEAEDRSHDKVHPPLCCGPLPGDAYPEACPECGAEKSNEVTAYQNYNSK